MSKNLLIQFIDSCDDAILLLKNTISINPDEEESLNLKIGDKFIGCVSDLQHDLASSLETPLSEATYRVIYMNPMYKEHFLSYCPQKLYEDFVCKEGYGSVEDNIKQRLIQHKELSINSKVIYLHGYPINALYYVLLFRDITEQHQSRESISKTKFLLEGVFENSFSALCVSDLEGNIVKFNRRFYSHLLSNYEFNFTADLNKGKVYDLPCFGDFDRKELVNFYSGTKERGYKVGEFYFTPYISSDLGTSYVLVEFRLDHSDAVREQVISELPDPTSRTLLSNLEADVIRLQRRVFEDQDSVVIQLDRIVLDLQSINDKLKPLDDLKGFFSVINWISTNIPWKVVIPLFLLYGGFNVPYIHKVILQNIFDVDREIIESID